MKRLIILASVLAMVILNGCSVLESKKTEQVLTEKRTEILEVKEQQKTEQAHRPEFVIKKERFIGSGRVALKKERMLPDFLNQDISLIDYADSFRNAVEKISAITNLAIEVPKVPGGSAADGGTKGEAEEKIFSRPIKFSFDGSLKGLMDYVAKYYSSEWEYDNETGEIRFYIYKTKTYTITASTEALNIESSISNNSSSNETEGSETSIEGSQKTTSKTKTSIFDDIKENIQVLAPSCTVFVNKSAGTVTVTAAPSNLKQIDQYIKQLNEKLSRQVVVAVKVYALELNADNETGFNLDAMFSTFAKDLNIAMGGASPFNLSGGAGSLTAAILETADTTESAVKHLSGSEMILQALTTYGDVSLVTSGSGITMNNQPLPIQIVQRTGYLKSTGIPDMENTVIAELTPGSVTTGFSMLATPHIIDASQVILRYNLSLSSLEELKTISSGDQSIQTPETSTRSFMQTAKMKLGSTLLMAGFEENRDEFKRGKGLTGFSRVGNHKKSVFVISITVNRV